MASEVSPSFLLATKRKFELAKQMAQDIVATIFKDADSEAKRPRIPKIGAVDDSSNKSFVSSVYTNKSPQLVDPIDAGDYSADKGFVSVISDHSHKPLDQQLPFVPSKPSSRSYKKIEIPNEKAGFVIGKGGEVVKNLMLQSGAAIKVARYNGADPHAETRLVEIMGTSEQINKAEQLISNILAETEFGGSGVIAAWKISSAQVQDRAEQFHMKIPNNKVGYVIGKGGETIKSMEAKSGAHIHVIPAHLPPGDAATERSLYIDGTSEQIEAAEQLVNEIINENRVRNSTARGYPSQGHRPPHLPNRGPPGCGYMQPGAYPGPAPQFNTVQPSYGTYCPAASGSYSYGWDQRTNQQTRPPVPTTGFNCYNQQQPSQQQNVGGSTTADGTTYNYGQPPSYPAQGSYGDSTYSQTSAGQQQGCGLAASAPQSGYQPLSRTSSFDQQGYGSTPGYGTVLNPSQDGSTTTYGVQGGASQMPPTQPVLVGQLPPCQKGHANQRPINSSAGYPAQGSAATEYGSPPYGNPPAQSGYGQSAPPTQPSYVAPPQVQQPPTQVVYGQGKQPVTAQSGYMQPATVPTVYGQVPLSQPGHVLDSSHRPPASYGLQPSGDAYGSGGISQPSTDPSDNATHGSYDAAVAAPAASAEATKASSPR